MTKGEVEVYSDSVSITNYELYNKLGEYESVDPVYFYNSNTCEVEKEALENALSGYVVDDLFNAIDNLNAAGGKAPSVAKLMFVDASGIYEIGSMDINEDTWSYINEWYDEFEEETI